MMFNFGKNNKKVEPPAPQKATKAVQKPAPVVNQFAGGLVGSDVEAPEFDPLQLSTGKSEETLAWYRAAELKVRLNQNLATRSFTYNRWFIAINSTLAFVCLLHWDYLCNQLSTYQTQSSTVP